MEQNTKLIHGDCLEEMKSIQDGSIDLVLTDPPYGTTACKWDTVINLDAMWDQLKRVIKPNGAIVLFGSQPFTSTLVMSNARMFKYCLVWEKSNATGHLNAKKMPMRAHEDIAVFYSKPPQYNPQKTTGHKRKVAEREPDSDKSTVYGTNTRKPNYDSTERYPRSVIQIPNSTQTSATLHPTQKPVALMEYLIRTYSNPGETVLDFTMGSGTTGVACQNTTRSFIGIELDQKYFEIAKKRIQENSKQRSLF